MARTVRSASMPTAKPNSETSSQIEPVSPGMLNAPNAVTVQSNMFLTTPNTLVDMRNDSSGDFTIETYKPAAAIGQMSTLSKPEMGSEKGSPMKPVDQLCREEVVKKPSRMQLINDHFPSSYRPAIYNDPSPLQGRPHRRAPMNQQEFDELFGLLQPQQPKGVTRAQTELKKCCQPCTSFRGLLNTIYGFIPILQWLPKYNWKNDLVKDMVGGLTVGIIHVPQGMAYGSLAGLDPVYGLYTSFFPAFFYMFFGTSRHVSLGVFAAVSLMVGRVRLRILPEEVWQAQLSGQLNETMLNSSSSLGDETYTPITIVTSLTLAVGIIQIIMGILRLDFLTAYLSDQVVSGFTTGAACHVLVAQLNKVLGVRMPRYSGLFNLYYKIRDLAYELPHANFTTVIISICSVIFLLFGKEVISPRVQKRFNIPIPFEFFLVIIATPISYFMRFQVEYDVQVVDHIPIGLPRPKLPRLELLPQVMGDAVGIAIVVFVVTVSMGKLFAKKHSYKVDFRQELYALGFMEVLCSFFSVYPASTALARSLVYEGAGTRTQLATVFSSLLLLIVLFLIGPLLQALPMCVLDSLVIVALKGMFMQLGQLKTLWPLSKIDFLIWLVSFVATVIYDVSEGLLISVVFALLTVVFRLQWAHSTGLGWMEATTHYREESRYDRATGVPGMRIIRFNAPLLFTNVERFKKVVHRSAQQEEFAAATDGKDEQKGVANKPSATDPENTKILGRRTRVKHIIIDCGGLAYIDSMGATAMKEIFLEMDKIGIRAYFAMANAQIHDLFRASGFYEAVPKTNFYPSVEDAVKCISNQNHESEVEQVKQRLRALSVSD